MPGFKKIAIRTLTYNFHDAIVVSCSVEPPNGLKLVVMLYEMLYPKKDHVQLIFGGINNFENVNQFVDCLNHDALDPNTSSDV